MPVALRPPKPFVTKLFHPFFLARMGYLMPFAAALWASVACCAHPNFAASWIITTPWPVLLALWAWGETWHHLVENRPVSKALFYANSVLLVVSTLPVTLFMRATLQWGQTDMQSAWALFLLLYLLASLPAMLSELWLNPVAARLPQPPPEPAPSPRFWEM